MSDFQILASLYSMIGLALVAGFIHELKIMIWSLFASTAGLCLGLFYYGAVRTWSSIAGVDYQVLLVVTLMPFSAYYFGRLVGCFVTGEYKPGQSVESTTSKDRSNNTAILVDVSASQFAWDQGLHF